jgi:hypothetical protein
MTRTLKSLVDTYRSVRWPKKTGLTLCGARPEDSLGGALVHRNWNAHSTHISVAKGVAEEQQSRCGRGSSTLDSVLPYEDIPIQGETRYSEESLRCTLQRDDGEVLPAVQELELDVYCTAG